MLFLLNLLLFQTIEEFHNIFGAELKAVTGDPGEIERVLEKVDGLVEHVEMVRYDPFCPDNKQAWKDTMNWFQKQVEHIETEATRYSRTHTHTHTRVSYDNHYYNCSLLLLSPP